VNRRFSYEKFQVDATFLEIAGSGEKMAMPASILPRIVGKRTDRTSEQEISGGGYLPTFGHPV
jgi:hypothetical protein